MGTQSRTGLETRGWPQSSIGGVDLGGTAFTTGLLYRALAVADSREAMDLSVSLATEILPGCDAAFSIGGDLGVLSLYGTSRAAFTIDDVHDGLALAAHVGAALAVELEVEHLEAALRSRTVIGQATGILMERFGMAPDHAFSVLSRLSQQTNVKLRHLAEQIVRTRTLPEA